MGDDLYASKKLFDPWYKAWTGEDTPPSQNAAKIWAEKLYNVWGDHRRGAEFHERDVPTWERYNGGGGGW